MEVEMVLLVAAFATRLSVHRIIRSSSQIKSALSGAERSMDLKKRRLTAFLTAKLIRLEL